MISHVSGSRNWTANVRVRLEASTRKEALECVARVCGTHLVRRVLQNVVQVGGALFRVLDARDQILQLPHPFPIQQVELLARAQQLGHDRLVVVARRRDGVAERSGLGELDQDAAQVS